MNHCKRVEVRGQIDEIAFLTFYHVGPGGQTLHAQPSCQSLPLLLKVKTF